MIILGINYWESLGDALTIKTGRLKLHKKREREKQ